MAEEEEIEICRQTFREKWEKQEEDFEDKAKFRYLNEDKGIDIAVIWKAYRLEYKGKMNFKL